MTSLPGLIQAVNSGEVILVPTDTVWGLACDPTNPKAIGKIFDIKQRPFDKPLPVLVADINQAQTLADFSTHAFDLAKQFWPGALTLILPNKIDLAVAPESERLTSIAVRVPDHPELQQLISKLPYGLATTSANISGQEAAARKDRLDSRITDQVSQILASEAGGKSASTIVEPLSDHGKIIRQGPITQTQIEASYARNQSIPSPS